MKIDYEITVCVLGMSAKKKRKVQDAFFKLGIPWADSRPGQGFERWGLCSKDHLVYSNLAQGYDFTYLTFRKDPYHGLTPTHTYTQLLDLANMTDKKQLTDLNSDELRTKLAKNTGKITKLKLKNDEIVELLRSRALAPIDVEHKVALTVDELKAGGWWMDSATPDDRDAFVCAGVPVDGADWRNPDLAVVEWFRNKAFLSCSFRVVSTENKNKQIHRIGNEFYWGAP